MAGIVALGSSSAKPDPETAEQLKKTARILLALDFDAAGINAVGWWQQAYPQVKLWPAPAGKDPGEAYANHGIDLKAWFTAGLPPAWRNRTALVNKTTEGRAADQVAPPVADTAPVVDLPPHVPAAVLELAELLRQAPVYFRNSRGQTTMVQNEAWARANCEASKPDQPADFPDARGFQLHFKPPGRPHNCAQSYR